MNGPGHQDANTEFPKNYRMSTRLLEKWQVGGQPILIIGHGRSGTTWVGNILSAARRVLYYFEPCNPATSGRGEFDVWFRYLRPGARDSYFESVLDPVFTGLPAPGQRWNRGHWHRWAPGYRIAVKEVVSLMSIEWLIQRYQPMVLLVVRHPCPVILSELRQGTPPVKSMQEMLKQPALFEDHLAPYRDLMERARTPFEILGAIWGARHRVVANTVRQDPDWHVVYYEELCINPVKEFRQIFQRFDLLWTAAMGNYVIDHSSNDVPGPYSGRRVSRDHIDKWKHNITPDAVRSVWQYVEPFNLPFYQSAEDWEI